MPREAISLNVSNVHALVHYGLLLSSELDQPQESLRLYRKALRVDPGYIPALYHCANLQAVPAPPRITVKKRSCGSRACVTGRDSQGGPLIAVDGVWRRGRGLV